MQHLVQLAQAQRRELQTALLTRLHDHSIHVIAPEGQAVEMRQINTARDREESPTLALMPFHYELASIRRVDADHQGWHVLARGIRLSETLNLGDTLRRLVIALVEALFFKEVFF